MAKIVVSNLKSVNSLEFTIPVGGVHVLTGINGSGKTTLLTCLQRITDRFAFQRHFRTSSSNQFDNYQSSQITYSNATDSVVYIYRNTRWSPNPRKNSSLLQNLGFTNTIFISSTGERFYVQNEELNTRGILTASQFFKDSMNEIFETNKYTDLRRKKLDGKGRGEGRWNYGFLMPLASVGGQNRYFTEKNFSLGEILILNALFQLERVANNSLVLIDEVELALHPRVQVKFLRFLEKIASQKALTIIISTHSSSLIKSTEKLIYLERDRTTGNVKIEHDCYPAIALQNVAVTEEVQPDFVFFVEDVFGRYILEEILLYYFSNIYNGRKPIYKIMPVGGWFQTIRFTVDSTNYLIQGNSQAIALLDNDVYPILQAIQANANRTQNEQEQLNLYNNNQALIKFLPITPELGIVTLLNNNPLSHFQPLQDHFNGVFDITQIIIDEANRGITYSANPRKAAKERLDYYIESIKTLTNRDYNYVRIKLAEYYAASYCPANHAQLQQTFNPIFN